MTRHFQSLVSARYSRRAVLAGMAGLPAVQAIAMPAEAVATHRTGFKPIEETNADTVTVPEGYQYQTLIGWGDPLYEDVSPVQQGDGPLFPLTRSEQEKRFGTCNDMLALFPAVPTYPVMPNGHSKMVLCANHEFFNPFMMVKPGRRGWMASATDIEAMYAAIGVTVVQVQQDVATKQWSVVKDAEPGSGLNRRITAFTPVAFSGPAATDAKLNAAGNIVKQMEATRVPETALDGTIPCGTAANCAGGYTPWGTYLTAEENFNNIFFTSDPSAAALVVAMSDQRRKADAESFGYEQRWPFGGPDQFDLSRNPYGPYLYGWIVEIDPYDPEWTPRKRTAIGRRKSECATSVLSKNGHAVVYSGDDQANEFVWKFVSKGRFDPTDRVANRELLNEGALYAARFDEKGQGDWLLINATTGNQALGEGSFADDGEAMIHARAIARALGATPMDRPEDVQSPADGSFRGQGSVYIMCTGNTSTDGKAGNAANPRRPVTDEATMNYTGHLVRINERSDDHASTSFSWDVFAVAGDPAAAVVEQPGWEEDELINASSWLNGRPTTEGDRFARPDNVCFDQRGNMWVSTDGNSERFPCNDGIYVMPTGGTGPRPVKRFCALPVGSEACGPKFSPDQRSFFLAVQHPGSESVDGSERYRGGPEGPYSNFPDGGWPRDAVIVITKKDGGVIGT